MKLLYLLLLFSIALPVYAGHDYSLDLEYSNSECAEGDDLDLGGSWTIAAWIMTESTPSSGAVMAIVDKWIWNSADRSYKLFYQNNGGTPRLGVWNSTDGTNVTSYLYKNVTLTNSQWYHIRATYDSSNGDMKLYLDGVEQTPTASADGSGAPHTNDAPASVGCGSTGVGARGDYFDGLIDEVMIADSVTDFDLTDYNDELCDPYTDAIAFYELENDLTDTIGTYEDLIDVNTVAFSASTPTFDDECSAAPPPAFARSTSSLGELYASMANMTLAPMISFGLLFTVLALLMAPLLKMR